MAVMVEVDAENYHGAPIHAIGLANESTRLYVPFDQIGWPALSAWMADPAQHKWVYDAKRSQVALAWKNIQLEGITFDALLASYLSNPSETNHRLCDIAERYGMRLAADDAIYGKGAKRTIPDAAV
ncbi:hypothetical protein, partial [Acinetobacter baumannii]|uniref:hypothetical protein n=1 Tax=Acinetobacter baumannii TaxID=470 RepID=UPI000B32E448